MKIKSFDRDTCKFLRSEIDSALKAVADKYGINLKAGNAKFSESSVTFKLEAAIIGEGGIVESKDAQEFKLYSHMYGLKETDLGKEFMSNGNRYVVCGMASRSFKFPILAKKVGTNSVFKFPPEAVKRGLGYPAEKVVIDHSLHLATK